MGLGPASGVSETTSSSTPVSSLSLSNGTIRFGTVFLLDLNFKLAGVLQVGLGTTTATISGTTSRSMPVASLSLSQLTSRLRTEPGVIGKLGHIDSLS